MGNKVAIHVNENHMTDYSNRTEWAIVNTLTMSI